MEKTEAIHKKPTKATILIKILCCVAVMVGMGLFFGAKWYIRLYGQQGFAAILYTVTTGAFKAEAGIIRSFIVGAICPAILSACVFAVLIFFDPRRFSWSAKWEGKKIFSMFQLRPRLSVLLAAAVFFISLLGAANAVELKEFMQTLYEKSLIYEEEYVDPENVEITFPEEKQNLIYIFLESMETTFFDTENGGALEENVIPELFQLAEDNINFSQDDNVGGALTVVDTTWTVAAMVAQTAGIPLSIHHYGTTSISLPGLTTLGDILEENGYYQVLMMGSDVTFADRDEYYLAHGTDVIYDYYTAMDDGIIDEDYYAWWGMEDLYLFEYAKEKLTEIAQNEEPFAFTLLTADTHFPDGYVCDLCQDEYDSQYENVYACSSRQVADFISWIQEQDFYENTTIVIVGDHKTMDNEYIEEAVTDPDYMLMYGKEASNRKQEIDRHHYTIPNQCPNVNLCGKI